MPDIVEKILASEAELLRLRRLSAHITERRRASILLARATGLTQTETAEVLRCGRSTVQRAEYLFGEGGAEALHDRRARGHYRLERRDDIVEALPRLVARQPQDLGWSRTTWSIELVCLEVRHQFGVAVSVAQMGRLLREAGCRRVRPQQTIALAPEDRDQQLARLDRWLEAVPKGDVVLFSDEVDIHLNPKIGPDWAPAGLRKTVVTPGRNKKHYVAGAYNPKTKTLITVDGESKASDLFIALLAELAKRYRPHGTIHLVVDNYSIHHSKKTQAALKALKGKVTLCFLPPYSPQGNPIERVWLDLHTAVTRNHRCPDLTSLLNEVNAYLTGYHQVGHRAPNLRRAA
jgi:putative transposase